MLFFELFSAEEGKKEPGNMLEIGGFRVVLEDLPGKTACRPKPALICGVMLPHFPPQAAYNSTT